MAEPYPNISRADRIEVNRLKSAAKRGDKRAEATLELFDQQKHTEAWEATAQARAELAAEREERNRNRPTSVSAGMEKLKRAREEKEARRKANAEQA